MPHFARLSGIFTNYSEMTNRCKSEQVLACYYYLLVVKIVVNGKCLLLRIYDSNAFDSIFLSYYLILESFFDYTVRLSVQTYNATPQLFLFSKPFSKYNRLCIQYDKLCSII